MEIDAITQFILAIVPAFTAVVGMVTTLGVAIGKIKKANKDATAEIKEVHAENVAIRKEMHEIYKENVELKRNLNKVSAKLDHVYFVDKEE